MCKDKNELVKKAIAKIKKAGFSHIKIELEAQLDRDNAECQDDMIECSNCSGSGHITIEDDNGVSHEVECDECNGDGEIENEYYNQWDEDGCSEFILDNISKECSNAITYSKFYNDGSVDSEFTFTLPVDNPDFVIEVTNAFSKLAEEIGQGMDVDGAGLHITLLTSGDYPTQDRLPSANIGNFTKQVGKLLPAMFIACTSGNFSRELYFRMPQIESNEKYSAIYTHYDTCIEYRLFETCYQRPDAYFEYLGMIAKTLKYYIDPTAKVESLNTEYPMYRGIDGLVSTPEQIAVVKKTFSKIKPDGYTMKELLETRCLSLNMTAARAKMAERIKKAKIAYKEYAASVKARVTQPIREDEREYVEYYTRNPRELRGLSAEDIENGLTEDKILSCIRNRNGVKSEQEYIQQNINSNFDREALISV